MTNAAKVQPTAKPNPVIEGKRIWPVDVHPDLTAVSSGRAHGNTNPNPKFGDPAPVFLRRVLLASRAACSRLVVMAPRGGDGFVDLDSESSADDMPTETYVEARVASATGVNVVQQVPCDGLITTMDRVGLMLGAADCAPLVLYDPGTKVLGLAHIGRRGAALGLAPNMLASMQADHGARPERVIAHFGPAIAPRSYLMDRLDSPLDEPLWQPHVTPAGKSHTVDFVGYTAARLVEAGVNAEHITTTAADTATDPAHFSYVAHKATGVPDGRNGFVVARCL